MYLPLCTIDVWEVEGDFDPCRFFHALPHVCVQDDVLVIGSYDVEESILNWLSANELDLPEDQKPFSDTFDLNRSEYPRGKCYALNPDKARIDRLASFCEAERGGLDRQLFFDHLLIYRPGEPLLPLVNFHDAFRGTLYLSGHYSEKVMKSFADALAATIKTVANPELKNISTSAL
jgi:hypothetical protein